MKKKIAALLILLLCFTCAVTCAACDAENAGSLKSLTHPYITQYECTSATLGEENILEKYDYIRITLLDDQNLEVSFKSKNGKKRQATCEYTYDEETGELCGAIGILGFMFKEKVIIRNGSFTLSKPFLTKMLVMNFTAK